MLVFEITILSSFLFVISADPIPSYDQRQSGELNVQIDLKNLKIFALMKGGKEEYVDYDYAYDYSEMTIKPTNGTTPRPLNTTTVTVEKDNTTNSTPTTLAQTTESIVKNCTNPMDTNGAAFNESNSNISQSAGDGTTEKITADTTSVADIAVNTTMTTNSLDTVNVNATKTKTNCRRGYVRNAAGECEYKVHGLYTANTLRRILAQKIKIGRRYKENSEDFKGIN